MEINGSVSQVGLQRYTEVLKFDSYHLHLFIIFSIIKNVSIILSYEVVFNTI